MAKQGLVHWYEGLFLQPHHLQWMQHTLLARQAHERKLSWAHPWGVVESRLSADALENMLVRFDRLHAVMPSGLEIVVPDAADLPPLDIKPAFEGSAGPLTVELGVPLWYETRGNTIELGEAGDWRVKRLFRVVEADRPDENTGENAQPVLMRRINARLMLSTDDHTDLETIPVLRITHAAGQDVGLPKQDPAFIPPCMLVGGSPVLRDMLRDLSNQVEASRKELVVQLTRGGFSVDAMRGVQFEQMLRLQTLNRFAGRLPQMVLAPGMTPFEVYLEFRELLGELAALQPDRDLFEAPAYDHANPAVAFGELSNRIRSLLRGSVAPSFMSIAFKREGDILLATLTDEHFTRPNEYFLGVKTQQDPRGLAKLVEDADRFKVMAKSMVQGRFWGIKLQEERHPPLELPSQTGLHYFRVLRADSERMWNRVREEKQLAIRWLEIDSSDFQVALYMTVPGDA